MYQRQVGFFEAISRAFGNYCNFSGRASRSEFWYFYLFNVIINIILGGYGGVSDLWQQQSFNFFSAGFGLYNLIVLLPTLGLCWRRLHDIGKGGGWYFVGLIPLVGWIILLIWFCRASEPAPNRFGPVPNLVDRDGRHVN